MKRCEKTMTMYSKKELQERITKYFDHVQKQVEYCNEKVMFDKSEVSNIISNMYSNVRSLIRETKKL